MSVDHVGPCSVDTTSPTRARLAPAKALHSRLARRVVSNHAGGALGRTGSRIANGCAVTSRLERTLPVETTLPARSGAEVEQLRRTQCVEQDRVAVADVLAPERFGPCRVTLLDVAEELAMG